MTLSLFFVVLGFLQVALGAFEHADFHAPLTRLQLRHEGHENLDARLLHQLSLNRAHKRRARMAGHPPPSDGSLRRDLVKRQLQIEDEQRAVRLAKRQRVGHGGQGSDFKLDTDRLVKSTWTALGPVLAEEAGGTGAGAGAVGQGTAAPAPSSGAGDNAVTQADTPTAANTVGENIEGKDKGYFATFQVGTPPQDVSLLIDSGSSDLWMPSVNCQADTGGSCNHQTLGTNSSSSFKATNTKWSITFGTGQVAGTLCQDNFAVAGLQLANHKFGTTDVETIDFTDPSIPFDGLIGAAKSQLSEQNQSTVTESLASNGLVNAAQMGYKLGRVGDGENDGQATFGGVDTSKFTGKLVEVPNVSQIGFFEAAMDGVSVDGNDVNLAGRTAILDTGTTLMVIPPDDAATIHAQIPGSATDGQGNYAVPCDTTSVVALTVGGQAFTINPKDVAFQPLAGAGASDAAAAQGGGGAGGQLCLSGISSGQIGGPNEWLVGDVFLKNVYYASDAGSDSVGLAALPNSVPNPGGGAGGKSVANAGASGSGAASAAAPAASASPAAAGAGTGAAGTGPKDGRKAKGGARNGKKRQHGGGDGGGGAGALVGRGSTRQM